MQANNWLTDELLAAVAAFLDFRSLNRLRATSRQAATTLLQEFRSKSHPHAVVCIARRIMQERIRTPCPVWMVMRIRDPLHLLRFEDRWGFVLFSSDIADDRKSLVNRSSYIMDDDGFNILDAFIEVTITPSLDNPMHVGEVSIKQGDVITMTGYTDGFDARRALEWCPIVM